MNRPKSEEQEISIRYSTAFKLKVVGEIDRGVRVKALSHDPRSRRLIQDLRCTKRKCLGE